MFNRNGNNERERSRERRGRDEFGNIKNDFGENNFSNGNSNLDDSTNPFGDNSTHANLMDDLNDVSNMDAEEYDRIGPEGIPIQPLDPTFFIPGGNYFYDSETMSMIPLRFKNQK